MFLINIYIYIFKIYINFILNIYVYVKAQQTHIIQAFWQNQLLNIEQTQTEFKSHSLPIARIKKVMKSDDDVKTLV